MDIPTMYWRDDMEVGNLGDSLGGTILELLGHTACSHQLGQPTLIGIGSLLSPEFLDGIPGEKLVWGSGSYGITLSKELKSQLIFHAVRGPKTRDFLNLPKDIPLGDPALLLSMLLPSIRTESKGILYIPHCNTVYSITKKHMVEIGATEFLSIIVTRPQILESVKRIANAEFVLTGSLHGAIIAQAFGVPWALCLIDNQQLVMPFKHDDWAEYLGIRLEVVKNIREGTRWWNKHGRYGKVQDLQPLLKAFPYINSSV